MPTISTPAYAAEGESTTTLEENFTIEAQGESEDAESLVESNAVAEEGSLNDVDEASVAAGGATTESTAEILNVTKPLGFIYFGESELTAGADQTIAIAIDDDTLKVSSAKLVYLDPDDETKEVAASRCVDSAALFTVSTDFPGTYQLVTMQAEATNASGEKQMVTVDLAKQGDNCAFFANQDGGMTLSIASEDHAAGNNSSNEISIYAMDEGGNLEDANAIDDALALAGGVTFASPKARANTFVIALDPGHGGTDSGACANGLREADINWAIAQACKAELQKYENVEVFVTRAQNECPGLRERVDRAVAKGAQVFVSLHINSTGSGTTTANGSEVWYPNSSTYNKATTTDVAKGLSQKILDELKALGLTDRGIKVRNSESGAKYPDGSVRDYYSVIAAARENNIPGIIVEHAFVNNASDAAKLADSAFLTKLGVADATGIAKYYDLSRALGTWNQDANGDYSYVKLDGTNAAGEWVVERNNRYYMDKDGKMVTGIQKIDGVVYNFNSSGVLQKKAGWVKSGNNWYYFTNAGTAQTGWLKSGSKWYYLDPSTGVMKTGMIDDGGVKYVLDGSGVMRANGWYNQNGTWYYLAKSGAAKTGWLKTGGKWYYLNPADAKMATGWTEVDGKRYFLNASGAMRGAGWFNQNGTWYYITGSGAAKTGWLKTGGKWYYLNPADAKMATGWSEVDGKRYFLNASGAMRGAGWFNQNGTWYYITGSGAAKTGWQKVGGKWYYLDPDNAKMKTGWAQVGDTWYYLNASGAMQKGWLKLGSTWYYLNPSGAMLTNWQKIGSKQYYFTDTGAMLTGEHELDGKPCFFEASGEFIGNGTPIMGASKTNAAAMAAAFDKRLLAIGKVYPSEALAKGGAPDTATFCKIIEEEAKAEGVRAEVVWAQIMHETGWLQFGGDVKVEQFNFAGIGATGGGVPGNSFPDVRTGIRAQVQHLKCYASQDNLNNEKVDPRWFTNLRGKAVLVEYLGIPDNPYGTGWAAGKGYGSSLRNLMKTCLGV